MAEENRGTIWVARVAVVKAAEAYEAAWTAYAHPRPLHKNREAEAEAIVAKGLAHQALLDAVRALKERRG